MIDSELWATEPMSLPELIEPHDARLMLQLAAESIEHFLLTGRKLKIDLDKLPESLCQQGAVFVTLTLKGHLRGCIGHLEATQPLLLDVIENARLAAFNDPRFAPLTEKEFNKVIISISVLSAAELMQFTSELDLLNQIRPGIDGLILEEGVYRGTFLPSVWESLPEPGEFLSHLKQKAGLHETYWSDSLKVSRYTTQHIE